MAWPNIDPTVPAGTEEMKFGDDRIREAKSQTVSALQAISNYSASGSIPAPRTTTWTTAGRPTGANLVDRVTGYNTTLKYVEYYDQSSATWKQLSPVSDHSTVSNAHTAANITNTASGTVSATNVQAAINELGTEKAALSGAAFTGAITVLAAAAAANPVQLRQITGSFNQNGYITIPVWNGSSRINLMFQWGVALVSTNHNIKIPFNTPFASDCFGVNITLYIPDGSPTSTMGFDMAGVKYKDKTGFYGGTSGAGTTFFWVAVGV